jgi:CubicO group peptidase (beta-lactamase class C family)
MGDLEGVLSMARNLHRRGVLMLAAGTVAISRSVASASDLSAEAKALIESGFVADTSEKLDLGFRSGLLSGLHAVVAQRSGTILFERYFAGGDEAWGRPLGNVTFDGSTLHDLRSVTKSITSLVYAIALAQGKVPPPDARLLDSFPEYPDLAGDPSRAGWTVDHVINMTLGTEWNEDLPYSNPANSEIMMERASDRYRFILDRPIAHKPGERWTYNGGCSAVLGHLIAKGTGQSLENFANETLFRPLGIASFEWSKGSDGVPSAASGLRLTARDLLRIGQLMLAKGSWAGRQIVPASWIEACMTPAVAIGEGRRYSHQWYLAEQDVPAAKGVVPMILANGNGGQRLFILPSLDIVVATLAGNYNRPGQSIVPNLVLQQIVLANLKRV